MNRLFCLLVSTFLVASCAFTPTSSGTSDSAEDLNLSACIRSLKDGSTDLSNALVTGQTHQSSGLDATGFSLLNWNIQKAKHPDWSSDLDRLGDTASLVTFQEAIPELPVSKKFGRLHGSFAEGFGIRQNLTGVMTLSDVRPIASCEFAEPEPVFRTRKATLVTNYPMRGTDETLLVINLHGVNFSMGLAALKSQFDNAGHIISHHSGPVVLSGDFNTWRQGRQDLIEDLMATHQLEPVEFDTDHRKRFLGLALDHILVRGLEASQAKTHQLDSSDHNPMLVNLRLRDES